MARKPLPRDEVGERLRIGATLKALRGTRSIDAVANHIRLSRPYLANIEAGRKRLTPELMQALADEYGVPALAIVHPDYYATASTEDAA